MDDMLEKFGNIGSDESLSRSTMTRVSAGKTLSLAEVMTYTG